MYWVRQVFLVPIASFFFLGYKMDLRLGLVAGGAARERWLLLPGIGKAQEKDVIILEDKG